MFLRKIFSSNNKFVWVIIDLLIVIIGVYCAFLIQSYAEDQKNKKERDRVETALKFEIEAFRFVMSEVSAGMGSYAKELNEIRAENNYVSFADYRFIEPQYDYQTVQYALNLQSSEVVDFQLYNVLQKLFVEIKKIEHAERLLTEVSAKYRTIPSNLRKSTPEYKLTWSENYDNFIRFATLIADRGRIAERVAEASSEALVLLNERMGPKKTKEIEKQIFVQNIHLPRNEEEAVFLAKKYFPKFSEEEIRKIYREAKGIKSDSTTNPTGE